MLDSMYAMRMTKSFPIGSVDVGRSPASMIIDIDVTTIQHDDLLISKQFARFCQDHYAGKKDGYRQN
jgi:hypothetical protein